MERKVTEKYFFLGLLLATLLLTFLIFRPFWVVLLFGLSFATVLYPVHKWFMRRKFPSWLSALITVILFTVIVCGPLLLIGLMVFDQSQNVYHVVVRGGGAKPFLEGIEKAVNGILPHVFTFDINAKLAQFVSYVSDNITKIFTSTVSAFYSFLLMLFIIFHFLKDGEAWRKGLIVFSPLPDEEDEKIIGRLSLAINAVMKGYLLVALVQGILMGFGLWIFHVPNPALWGVVAAVASLIPTIGTALVSVPAIIFLGSTGHTALALGLLAWAVVVVGMIDNVLSPYVVGKKINTPSLFILFSVLGGISVLGPAGILVGPLAVSLLFTLISIYRHDFN